jgi:MFS family permease
MYRVSHRRHVAPFLVRPVNISLSSILATNTLTLVFLLGVNFTQVASLTGYFLLGVGCCAWLISASARVYGKRHTYVFGSILLVAGSIWGAVAKDYNSLLGARIMQGFGTGPFEMLVPSSIGDMYTISHL